LDVLLHLQDQTLGREFKVVGHVVVDVLVAFGLEFVHEQNVEYFGHILVLHEEGLVLLVAEQLERECLGRQEVGVAFEQLDDECGTLLGGHQSVVVLLDQRHDALALHGTALVDQLV